MNQSEFKKSIQKSRIYHVDQDSIREIFSFLNYKEFSIFSFMVSKHITEIYKYQIYKEIIKNLLQSWNISDHEIISSYLYDIITINSNLNSNSDLTVYDNENSYSKQLDGKLSFLKSLLYKSYPIIEHYRTNNPENINVYEILLNKSYRSTVAAVIVSYDPKYSSIRYLYQEYIRTIIHIFISKI